MNDMNKTANNVMNGLNRNMSKLAVNSRLQDSSLYNITETVATLNQIMNGLQAKVTDLPYLSRKADIPLTLARLRGRKDNNVLTWNDGRDLILQGDVQYENTEKCLRVKREGHFLVYSQLCVFVPSTSSAVHFTQSIQRRIPTGWHRVLYKELSVQRGRNDCTYMSGIVHLDKNDCVKVGFSDEEYIISNHEYNSFGLYMLA
ncbi:uncharacterized protein LOC106175826 [Lingula anatina]|uniref:Uncharacterized protein LOC106175826 n=1 Tax=Lingula anatina TaxID=7574 RepID=A0A1S3JTP1_LINAN|nr:uncharacterized protein LOC106175826 [Lingula anatina]|eukprot:XP_013413434.1 uncharacterized protein LOC106175826 [Lingula anatina]